VIKNIYMEELTGHDCGYQARCPTENLRTTLLEEVKANNQDSI
jgi:hypothetical protein